jgi:hypothetical protein
MITKEISALKDPNGAIAFGRLLTTSDYACMTA